MMRKFALVAAMAALALSVAAPAFAVGSDGAGREFGQHHASHARDDGGFTGDMNPGKHQGFSNFGEHED